MFRKARTLIGVTAALVALTLGGAAAASASTTSPTATPVGPQAFQGGVTNQNIVLGPQSNPTLVVKTPGLPVGNYLVSYSVGTVMGPTDNVVCAASLASQPNSNDGLFGTTGNGSSTSGVGPGGIYANATMTDIITVTTPGDAVAVGCNHTSPTAGTYVGAASVTAVKLGTATRSVR